MVYFLNISKRESKNTGKINHFCRLLQADGFGVWGSVDYWVTEETYDKIIKLNLFPGVPVLVVYAISSGFKGNSVSLQSLRLDNEGSPLELIADTE